MEKKTSGNSGIRIQNEETLTASFDSHGIGIRIWDDQRKGSRWSMKKVFVVDDSGPYRMLLRELLQREGHEVMEASNGEEAIQQIRRTDFHADVLLLDLQMPKKDGFEVLRVLSRMKSKVSFPILVMSGIHNSLEEIERVRELGALGIY